MQQKDFKLSVLGTGQSIHATELAAMMEDREFLELLAEQLKIQVNQHLDQEEEETLFFQVYDIYWRGKRLSTTLATGVNLCFETGNAWWFVATFSEEMDAMDWVESLPCGTMETRKVAHWILNQLAYFGHRVVQEECRINHWLPMMVKEHVAGDKGRIVNRPKLKRSKGQIIPFPSQL